MNIVKKIIGFLLVAFSSVNLYIVYSNKDLRSGVFFLTIITLFFGILITAGLQLILNKRLFPYFSQEAKEKDKRLERENKAKQELIKKQKEEELTYSSITLNSTCTYKGSRNFEDMIIANGYNVDKHIKINSKTDVYVNDTNKVFFIRQGQELKTYEFNKILDYEVTQNNEIMVKGKSMATLAGGLLFGLGGAIVGSSGKRKQVNSVSNVNFNIYLNELNNPQITLPLLTGRLKVNSYAYENLSKTVNELISVFKYIEANK